MGQEQLLVRPSSLARRVSSGIQTTDQLGLQALLERDSQSTLERSAVVSVLMIYWPDSHVLIFRQAMSLSTQRMGTQRFLTMLTQMTRCLLPRRIVILLRMSTLFWTGSLNARAW